jgi:hypothetical protein
MSLSNLIAQREALERQQAELTKAIAEAQMTARRGHCQLVGRSG